MKALIGIDVGGTNIVCGVVDLEGTVLFKIKKSTEAELGEQHVIVKVAEMIEEVIRSAGFQKQDILGVGIGTPGLVDPERGVTMFSNNLGWTNVPLASSVAKLVNLPVSIDNDVRMYVLGEALKGAAQSYRHVLGITVGTGLAAAFVVDQQLYYGGAFLAGELGHISIDQIPYACKCGLHGCLETVASATGMVKQALDRLHAGQQSILTQWMDEASADESFITAAILSRAYDVGDSLAIDVFDFTGRMLGKGLASATMLFNPDVIVIGGGVVQAGERLLQPLQKQLQASILPNYWEKLNIKLAILGDDAGIIGSALNALNQRKDKTDD